VAPTRAGVLCVWSTIRQAASDELFSLGSAATLLR